jgi:hypothetical protein
MDFNAVIQAFCIPRAGFEITVPLMAVFWVVEPCSLVEVYQRFRGPCYLHHRPDVVVSKDL